MVHAYERWDGGGSHVSSSELHMYILFAYI